MSDVSPTSRLVPVVLERHKDSNTGACSFWHFPRGYFRGVLLRRERRYTQEGFFLPPGSVLSLERRSNWAPPTLLQVTVPDDGGAFNFMGEPTLLRLADVQEMREVLR